MYKRTFSVRKLDSNNVEKNNAFKPQSQTLFFNPPDFFS